eukprot:TRINITY_DN7195_c0_g1_i1.p1 TRINITY_DN7195_c0_g1~~TRINITY_DN7195_c0_g1_i1.p1  ORF type:complete len:1883 (+),score=326.43 TRINITY_DN7195_c0_g1_i1:226-5649(+)
MVHSIKRTAVCKYGEKCNKAKQCTFLHPNKTKDVEPSSSKPSRSSTPSISKRAITQALDPNVCSDGAACYDYDCHKEHPRDRTKVCKFGGYCSTRACEYIHPSDWNPVGRDQVLLKSLDERNEERVKSNLPILSKKDEFVSMLRRDRVVVVTAETGSGKTTQLPQYAAEAFPKLVVCTQPRAIAAMSIAMRVAEEYDGTSVGENVGYKIGRGKSRKGGKIMLTTDASLIQMAQKDELLNEVSVLIIDEAHERNLNTDIVIGISNLILRKRKDFFVVIASATIDPRPFISFYKSSIPTSDPKNLEVAGRKFDVELEYKDYDEGNVYDNIISETKNALLSYTEGNCLVFLPGSGEVDKMVKKFNLEAMDDWVCYPLYGSMPPEEQMKVMSFDGEDGKRMIVFCTNVAETSLTVPNTRLVIDTGLAKEARYDPIRRINVIELVYISKSSANQRKGRAGRTAPGVCIRLYDEKKLIRDNIQPEIMRASLDSVVLSLCKLNQDPRTFPLMDQPPISTIETCLTMLEDIQCIQEGTVKVTPRGNLFSELPFDPRLSNFVVTAYEKYGQGNISAEIASLLSAPGSIFFVGGNGKERDNHKKKHSLSASNHDSDLMLLHSTYSEWFNSGYVEDGKCQSCNKDIKPFLLSMDEGCKACRIKYSVQNSLNNKILDIARNNSKQVIKLLTSKITATSSQPYTTEEAIGRSLALSFPEQIAEWFMIDRADLGIYLMYSKAKGTISSSSSFAQKATTNAKKNCIVMSMTQLTSGMLIVDKIHTIDINWMKDEWKSKASSLSLNMKSCYLRSNIHNSVRHSLAKYLDTLKSSDPKFEFVICTYKTGKNELEVYCQDVNEKEVRKECESFINKHIKNLTEWEERINIGATQVTYQSGMIIKNTGEKVENLMILQMKDSDIQFKTKQQVKDWLLDNGIKAEDILWTNIRDKVIEIKTSGLSTIEKIRKISDACNYDVETQFKEVKVEVRLEELIDLKSEEYFKLKFPDFKLEKCHPKKIFSSYFLWIPYIKNAMIPQVTAIDSSLKPTIKANTKDASSSSMSYIFKTIEERKEFTDKLSSVVGTIKMNMEQKVSTSLLYSFKKPETAIKFYDHAVKLGLPATGESYYTVEHPELHNLDSILKHIATTCSVKYKVMKNNSVRFFDSSPSNCTSALQSLMNQVSPLHAKFIKRQQVMMIKHIDSKGLFTKWETEFGIKIDRKVERDRVNMKVFGSPFTQGTIMANIAEESKNFKKVYELFPVDPNCMNFFKHNKIGDAKLSQLNKKYQKKAVLTSVIPESSIEVYLSVEDEMLMESIIDDLKELVRSISSESATSESHKKCIFCASTAPNHLSICGHSYCNDCLASYVRSKVRYNLPIQCPKCDSVIYIKNLVMSLSKNELSSICIQQVKSYHNKSVHSKSCKNPICIGVIQDLKNYTKCNLCGLGQCFSCHTENNDNHINLDCDKFKEWQSQGFDKIYERALEFLDNNWQSGAIIKKVKNPGVLNGSPSMMKFLAALKERNIDWRNVENSFFGWHGTPIGAIAPICHDGFDPSRRSGQMHGAGEYFGQSSEVSRGYCGGGNLMIVALILKVPETSTHGNFCYVVNNPKQWTTAYCLPVLVVNFGTDAGEIKFIDTEPRDLMKFMKDDNIFVEQKNFEHEYVPFRWLWKDDSGKFEPYTERMSRQIESHYCDYISGGQSNYLTQPITRYVDDKSNSYNIDYQKMIQINSLTRYTRQVKREAMYIVDHSDVTWQYYAENNEWINYEDMVQATLEKSFLSYRNGKYQRSTTIQFPGRPESYLIDFVTWTQTNQTSNTQRNIRRKLNH